MSKRVPILPLVSSVMVRTLAFLFVMTLLLMSAFAQQPREQITTTEVRVVEKMSRKQAPLEIKMVKTRNGGFLIGQKFADDAAWYKGLSVVLENTSIKTITYIDGGFLFTRESDEVGKAPPFYKTLFYGRHPGAPAGTYLEIQPLALKPGDKITFTLSDDDFSEVKMSLKQLDYSHSVKKIKFNLSEIYFEDGTSWVAGTWFNRVPEHLDSDDKEQQPFSRLSKTLTSSLSFSPIRFDSDFSTSKGRSTALQETCTGSPG